MLDQQQLPEKIAQEIEGIAYNLDLLKRLGSEQVCYKRDYSNGKKISYKPIKKKLNPTYSVAVCTSGHWYTLIYRQKKIEGFRDTIRQIITKMRPDFIRVCTYQNESRNYLNAGETVYTIVLNPQAKQPPDLSAPPQKPANQIHRNAATITEEQLEQLLRPYLKNHSSEIFLLKAEMAKKEVEFQIKLEKKNSELTHFKTEVENQLQHLQRDYNKAVQESKAAISEQSKLKDELEISYGTIEDLNKEIRKREQQIAELTTKNKELTTALEQKKSAPETNKGMGNIEYGIKDLDISHQKQEPIEKVSESKSEHHSQTEEEILKSGLCKWINKVKEKGVLQVLFLLICKLSAKEKSPKELYEWCIKEKG